MHLAAVLAVMMMGLSAGDPDSLPAPNPIPAPPPYFVLQPWGRTNRYAAWQNYGVNLQGRWRPRVLYTPDGAFYTIDGRPYPWMTTHPLEFMPYANE